MLFSAAYRQGSPLLRLWNLEGVRLLTSAYAVEEAGRNLPSALERRRLEELSSRLSVLAEPTEATSAPRGICLPAKDLPILQAAILSGATHLVTGDRRHFGALYGKRPRGVLILTPAAYLARRKGRPSG